MDTTEVLPIVADSACQNNIRDNNKCYVLYVDHQGHPAPIDESYHATASRRLSSTIINRGYPSTIQNVDSAYCPQCLTVYTELAGGGSGGGGGGTSAGGGTNTSNAGYYCSKSSCRLCPICLSVASIRFSKYDDDTVILYGCGNCGWSSETCNVHVPVPSSGDGDESRMGRLEMIRATDELGNELMKQKRIINEPFEQYCNYLQRSWAEETGSSSYYGGRVTPRVRSRVSGDRSPTQRIRGRVGGALRRSVLKDWSMETLEASLQEKRKKLLPVLDDNSENEDGVNRKEDNEDEPPSSILDSLLVQPPKGLQIQRVPIKSISSDQQKPDVDDTILANMLLFSYQQQAVLNSPFVISSNNDKQQEQMSLLPLQIPLRLRTSRRCRAELAEGRPGILLKPKLNPLEGDSSLRTGHGQWHKKDCSAIAIIPRINIVQHQKVTNDGVFVFLLKVSNPTLGTVRLRFTASSYTGEPKLFPDDDNTSATADLPDLVVDTTTEESLLPTIVHATVNSAALQNLKATETIELLSSEDSIIELGAVKARETPSQVLEWNFNSTSSTIDLSASTMRFVAQSASDAWFELVAIHPRQEEANNTILQRPGDPNSTHRQYLAFPLALQVEVGNGSWESSLIPTTTDKDDYVNFDVLLVCPTTTDKDDYVNFDVLLVC